jgi:hypothetical protein
VLGAGRAISGFTYWRHTWRRYLSSWQPRPAINGPVAGQADRACQRSRRSHRRRTAAANPARRQPGDRVRCGDRAPRRLSHKCLVLMLWPQPLGSGRPTRRRKGSVWEFGAESAGAGESPPTAVGPPAQPRGFMRHPPRDRLVDKPFGAGDCSSGMRRRAERTSDAAELVGGRRPRFHRAAAALASNPCAARE